MGIQAKLVNPVCIRIGKNFNVVVLSGDENNGYPLEPGVMFNGEHYGFVLIVDGPRSQKELVYPTQCKIEAIGKENDVLKVFEYGKKVAWHFLKSGKLEQSADEQFTDEFLNEYRSKVNIVSNNYDMFMGNEIFDNPIKIKVATDPSKSTIVVDDKTGEELALYPGVMFGRNTVHYGFTLVIERPDGILEERYPTQSPIDAIEALDYGMGNIRVFENGKYFPWIVRNDGKIIKKSAYNPMAKQDKQFTLESCISGVEDKSRDIFTLSKKR